MKELDIVLLADGREGTVIIDYGEDFMIEISGDDGKTIDTPIISKEDVKEIVYSA